MFAGLGALYNNHEFKVSVMGGLTNDQVCLRIETGATGGEVVCLYLNQAQLEQVFGKVNEYLENQFAQAPLV